MMHRLFVYILIAVSFASFSAMAEVKLLEIGNDPLDIEKRTIEIANELKATPEIDPLLDVGFRLILDDVKYYILPVMIMLKSRPDEVCTYNLKNSKTYRCIEGQPNVRGCHLLFLNAQGKFAGLYTLQIKESSPHYCNNFPAFGVTDKASNSLMVTVQYFIPAEGRVAKKISEIGLAWYRMTILFRVKANNNGRIEVEQDDECLGNPNRIDNIPEARKLLRQCASTRR
jgi:hypothetical protein